jgi:peptidoglycan/LPS O-acetylase OafA/YrhL
MKFRYDINGLRALAVVGVVLFHFKAQWLPGGYAGVDVFFVISGFLMTSIISHSIDDSSFSLLKFYTSRFNRIVPALTVLCMSLLVFGWFFLPPLDYFSLSKHVASSLSFVSNFLYFQEIGYFDAEAHEKWLLHTWSLSVEWQFYILYPIVLYVINKITSKKIVNIFIVSSTVLGFVFCIFATRLWPDASYYLLPMRCWELFLGGVSYIYTGIFTGKRRALELTGFFLIIGSFILFSNENQWPGYLAFIPTFGAFLIIISDLNKSTIFNNKLTQYLGSSSYSIYLWHWPLVVFINYYDVENFTVVAIVLSVMLGFFSYKKFERLPRIGYFFLFTMTLSIFLSFNNGFLFQMPKRIYDSLLFDPKDEQYGNYTWSNHKQFTSGFSGDKLKMLIIGDSQAGDFTNILIEAGVNDKYDFKSSLISAKCGSFYLNEKQRKELLDSSSDIKEGKVNPVLCDRQWNFIYGKSIVKDADVIVIAMNWRDYSVPFIEDSIHNLILDNKKAKIIFVGRKSLGVNVPRSMFKSYKEKIDLDSYLYEKSRRTFQFNDEIEKIVHGFDSVVYIDFEKILCSDKDRKCTGFYKGKPMFYDGPHSTKEGNIFFSHEVRKILVQKGIL